MMPIRPLALCLCFLLLASGAFVAPDAFGQSDTATAVVEASPAESERSILPAAVDMDVEADGGGADSQADASAEPSAKKALGSVAGIGMLTFVLIQVLRTLVPELKGRPVLIANFCITVGLTVAALVLNYLPGDPVAVVMAVLTQFLNANGVHAAGSTAAGKTTPQS